MERRQKYYLHKRETILLPTLRYHSSRQDQSGQEMTIVRDVSPLRRKHRQRLEMLDESPLRLSKLRPQPAIQFSGDTSKYILGQHHNYKGILFISQYLSVVVTTGNAYYLLIFHTVSLLNFEDVDWILKTFYYGVNASL